MTKGSRSYRLFLEFDQLPHTTFQDSDGFMEYTFNDILIDMNLLPLKYI